MPQIVNVALIVVYCFSAGIVLADYLARKKIDAEYKTVLARINGLYNEIVGKQNETLDRISALEFKSQLKGGVR
jgi:hypothetical protein